MVSTNENRHQPLSSGEVESKSWQGPRTIFVQKNSQGFGFTLRHFIVYPPDSSFHNFKDEENGNTTRKGCQRSHLEPMDTIFVKSIKEQGPAQQAGLCTGDRLVKVNGETILGKTYSQVIALIQNSENILELSIMPNDEDVLQLVYSQDAYLKCSEPFSSEEQNLPEPQPVCYSSLKSNSAILEHSHNPHSSLDNWQCRTGPATSQLDNRSAATSTLNTGWHGASSDTATAFTPAGRHRSHSSSAISALDFHFSNHNAAITSATLPPPRRSGLPASARAHADTLCHQALSDWYYSQAEAAERMSPRHRSVSQDCLAELGLGLALGPVPTTGTSAEQHRRETLLYHHHAAASSHQSYWLGGWDSMSGPESRSCSESLLAAYAEYEHNYGRSVETLAQASALVSPRYENTSQIPHMTNFPDQKDQKTPDLHQQEATVITPVTTSFTVLPTSWQPGQQVAEPQTRRVKEDEKVDYKSYSPSFSNKDSQHLHQPNPFREPSYSSSHIPYSPDRRSCPENSYREVVPHPQSTPAASTLEEEKVRLVEDREVNHTVTIHQDVVMRQKPPTERRTLVQPLHNTTPVESSKPCGLKLAPENPSTVTKGTKSTRRANGSLSLHAFDSLSSIPFIDEATSPTTDHQTSYVPAFSVVSSFQASNVATLPSTFVTPTLSSVSPFVQLCFQDCSSIKSRRSSYLLAITTERSKSCDEGLNTFREESRMLSKLPKRVKSFFTDGSLESLRAEEEARSKRHSTSELGTITFSDVRKEGWLHYKQILTEKGKKVGGGMRPWKRAFFVLRSSSLFLHKDKREAVLHGASTGPGQDEHPPISIRGCLIDIAYSETKRKHTLRVTTQDFCEYLLQAEDRDDMLAWIRVIRENSKTDNEEIGSTRQALINKKMNKYKKHSLTGNKPDSSPRAHRMMPPFFLAKTDNTVVNRGSRCDDNKPLWGINIMKKAKKTGSPKAFGVRLEDCQPAVNHMFVPLIVEMCCSVVEAMGLEYTGIYRVPGNNAMVSNLQEHLNKGMDINTAEERWQDLNVISSLLKSFFRKLPEPLFTDDKYNEFITANRIEDAEDRFNTMKKLIQDLPNHYYHTLKFLVGHLKKVADHAEKNKMEPRNLALVFGPTLVRTSEDNMTDMVTHMPDRYKIVETLILHFDWFFIDGELNKEEKTPEDKCDMQPVPNIDHLLSNIGRPGMPGETLDSATSNLLKSKFSSVSKKDLNAKDFLPKALIFAVTRKREKCLSNYLPGSSPDEDSEHEPVKASNYRGKEGGEKEEDKDRGERKPVNVKQIVSGKQKLHNKEHDVTERKDLQAEEEPVEEVRNRTGNHTNDSQRESPQSTTQPTMQRHPHSLIYSLHHIQPTFPKLPPGVITTSNSLNQNLSRVQPTIPLWIFPNKPLSLYQVSTQQPDWKQSPPVGYRKARSGITRAVSMNLELELGRSEDRIRNWRTDKVEVIKVIEGSPDDRRLGGIYHEGPGPLIHFTQEVPHHVSSVHVWTDQRSLESTAVVLSRSGQDSQDKIRACCRQTVVV